MILIGITGNIASGKSFALQCISSLKHPVLSSDKLIAKIYQSNLYIQQKIKETFPKAVSLLDDNLIIDKQILSRYISVNPQNLIALEKIILPVFHEELKKFLKQQASLNKEVVCIEHPLLFEKNNTGIYDAIITIYSDNSVIEKRLVDRNYDQKLLDTLRNRQFSQQKKILLSNYALNFSSNKKNSKKNIQELIENIIKIESLKQFKK